MYSEDIQERLEEEGIEIGDRVEADGHRGSLMPKPESGDPEVLVLKLESGYNIGVKADEVELLEKREAGEESREGPEYDGDKPDILVLHTGGTIASRVSYEEGGVKPAFDPEDLVEMYPEVAEEVNVHAEVVAQMLSEDMEPGHWQQIAEKIAEEKDEYDGIIVGHGTDTMHYTGAALSLMLQDLDTAVLLVGAQRSSDRPSTDASANLYCAARFIAETGFSGIGICMHSGSGDDQCSILPAAKSRKMHTSRRDAFKPVNAEPLATVSYPEGGIDGEFRDRVNGEFQLRTGLDTEVGYLKTRPGLKPEELDNMIEQGYSGVVIEGTGLGHLPVNAFDGETGHHEEVLEKLEELAEDAVVVMASQCINGRVNMDVYDAGLKIQNAGVIGAEDMHPELAYVKLMWALGQADSKKEAEQLFRENVAGEINERSVYRG